MNPSAAVFVPKTKEAQIIGNKIKKTKAERGPRKRCRKKKEHDTGTILNSSVSDTFGNDGNYYYDNDDFGEGDFPIRGSSLNTSADDSSIIAASGGQDNDNDSLGGQEQLDWGAWFDSIVDRFGPSNPTTGNSPIAFSQKYSVLWAQQPSSSNGGGMNHSNGNHVDGVAFDTASSSFSSSSPLLDRYDDLVARLVSSSEDVNNGDKSWLDLHQEWSFSKSHLVSAEEEELIAEAVERKKWGMWATHAAEKERQRRISALAEIDAAQDLERQVVAYLLIYSCNTPIPTLDIFSYFPFFHPFSSYPSSSSSSSSNFSSSSSSSNLCSFPLPLVRLEPAGHSKLLKKNVMNASPINSSVPSPPPIGSMKPLTKVDIVKIMNWYARIFVWDAKKVVVDRRWRNI